MEKRCRGEECNVSIVLSLVVKVNAPGPPSHFHAIRRPSDHVIGEVYGTHNYPGMPLGQFGIRPGPLMAAADHLTIDIEGVGGHAARPHLTIDTVLVGAQIVNALQSIVSRNVDPLQSAVISICRSNRGASSRPTMR